MSENRAARVSGYLLALVIMFTIPAQAKSEMTVHFIDVGQGGAVLIQKAGKTYMYDCGDTFAGKDVVDYLQDQEVAEIDSMIISHAHKDHMGGCIDVLNSAVKVGTVYYNGSKHKTKTWTKFLKVARQKQTALQVVEKDMTVDGIELMVAYDSHGEYDSEADNSILARFVDNKVKVLLTGDCEIACEREVVKQSTVDATVLNVGHHGSKDSSSEEFLRRVKPKIAVISVGKNSYGHPTTQAMKRLDDIHAKKYRTDHDGSVVIESNGVKVKVQTDQ